MNFLKHMAENLFITFTGIAALVHSTWSLGTMFSGAAPEGDYWQLASWLLPAFFVAFALDVGQISTSAAIRHNGLTWRRGLAFFVFAVATYYLQFLYIAHHMPALAISDGVSDFHRMAVQTARDAAIWILPLLLPLSTMLYTISDGDSKDGSGSTPLPERTISIEAPEKPMLSDKSMEFSALTIDLIPQAKFPAHCEDCGWHKEYDDSGKAEKALNAHKSIHCKAKVIEQNGHVN